MPSQYGSCHQKYICTTKSDAVLHTSKLCLCLYDFDIKSELLILVLSFITQLGFLIMNFL